MKQLPTLCPSCAGMLAVKRLYCEHCGTEVEGEFELPPLARLSTEEQGFLLQFLKADASLKELARILRFSYPTVRNRLDAIIEQLKRHESKRKEKK
ncbi:MAG TPA: DUF2089 family protein [Candidatus Binatia bacterium]|nr:DUF2089 family protein [Candidatus Binatia bacterium]